MGPGVVARRKESVLHVSSSPNHKSRPRGHTEIKADILGNNVGGKQADYPGVLNNRR